MHTFEHRVFVYEQEIISAQRQDCKVFDMMCLHEEIVGEMAAVSHRASRLKMLINIMVRIEHYDCFVLFVGGARGYSI